MWAREEGPRGSAPSRTPISPPGLSDRQTYLQFLEPQTSYVRTRCNRLIACLSDSKGIDLTCIVLGDLRS